MRTALVLAAAAAGSGLCIQTLLPQALRRPEPMARARLSQVVASAAEEAGRTAKKGKRRPSSKQKAVNSGAAATAERPLHAEPCNVVLTHTNTDFDSLAAAVALAKLWGLERPELPTHVVLPRGVNPLVARFLAYHKHLLPVRGFSTINPEDLHAVGIVDTQSRDRLGPAAAWLSHASHVAVYDHHLEVSGDISADELVLEPVGSATTVLVERLRQHAERKGTFASPAADSSAVVAAAAAAAAATANAATQGHDAAVGGGSVGYAAGRLTLSQAEATLFALGIRADTGGLSYADTTPRDGHALVWLMENGASQHAIAEFGHGRLSAAQRDVLSNALFETSRCVHEGLQVGRVHLDSGRGFMAGMAAVAEELLSLMGLDVVLLAVTHENAKAQVFISLIGRASARAKSVDLNAVMRTWEGGGHPAAAAASFRLSSKGDEAKQEALAALDKAHSLVLAQVPQQVTAGDLMTTRVFACSPDETMDDARAFMLRVQRKAAPVVDTEGTFLGMLKYRDVMKALQASKGSQRVKSWMRRDVITVTQETPLDELEEILLEGSVGRLPVVSEAGRLLGLVTRTDVLRQRQLYSDAA